MFFNMTHIICFVSISLIIMIICLYLYFKERKPKKNKKKTINYDEKLINSFIIIKEQYKLTRPDIVEIMDYLLELAISHNDTDVYDLLLRLDKKYSDFEY